jgi:hypothetical protein
VRPSITYKGREVEDPTLRALLLVVGVMTLCVVLMALPVIAGLHPLFRMFGRRGTLRSTPDGRLSIALDGSAFRRAR